MVERAKRWQRGDTHIIDEPQPPQPGETVKPWDLYDGMEHRQHEVLEVGHVVEVWHIRYLHEAAKVQQEQARRASEQVAWNVRELVSRLVAFDVPGGVNNM